MAVAAVCASTVLPLARPAAGDQLSDAKAQAASIEAKIQATGAQISALGQQYDAAQYHQQQLEDQISSTKAAIAKARTNVVSDQASLRKAAINAYISNNTGTTANPLFSSDEKTYAAKVVYTKVAEGTLNTAVANLTNSKDALTSQESKLQTQESAAAAATASAAASMQQAQALQAQQNAALSQVKGQVATLIKQQQAQAAAQQQATAQAAASTNTDTSGSFPPPPSNAGPGAIAVAAAESQIGVPYVWADSDPGVGFDCSGLTMWAWAQAGVDLPHYSGAQEADSAPVPSLADAEPGDLIFYGPGGSEHVAMYIGGGMMIEAPYTGATVHITPVRMDFQAIGRP
jgi:cell wall-associated NlpC family hydrolase